MGTGSLRNCRIAIIWPIEQYAARSWNRDNFEKWTKNAGGRLYPKFTDDTTHLVISEKVWKQQGQPVQQAFEARERGRHIKIISPDWLQDCLESQLKRPEGPYSWEKLDKAAMQEAKKLEKETARIEKQMTGPQTTSGLMKEVFQQETERHVDPREKERMEREIEEQRRVQRQMAEEEAKKAMDEKKEAIERKKKEQAALFRKGAKKARNEIFSENHHIYADDTGFKYEVLLTKIDTRQNRNERCALTIYESNAEPHTYAMNLHFAGTSKLPHNTILAAIGCNFLTAFSIFKKTFKEKTTVDWDDRISFAVERAKREKRIRGQATNSPPGSARGVPVSESGVKEEEFDFRNTPFQYHPPLYGPRGTLPEKVRATFSEVGPLPVREVTARTDEVELWMSGANGSAPEIGSDQAATQSEAQLGDFDAPQTPKMTFATNPDISQTPADFDSFMDRAMNDFETGNFDFDTSYPFEGGEDAVAGAEDVGNAVSGAQPTDSSSNQPAAVTDEMHDQSLEGQTQVAEMVGQELLNLDTANNEPTVDTIGVNQADSSEAADADGTKLDLGGSILGKRKASPDLIDGILAGAAEHVDKSAKLTEVGETEAAIEDDEIATGLKFASGELQMD